MNEAVVPEAISTIFIPLTLCRRDIRYENFNTETPPRHAWSLELVLGPLCLAVIWGATAGGLFLLLAARLV